MKYKIILKSGASFELKLSISQSKDLSDSMLVRNGFSTTNTIFYADGFVYTCVNSGEIVAMIAIEEDED